MKKHLLTLLLGCSVACGLTPQQVMVVYNADSKLSKETALQYASLRSIPAENLVPLKGITKAPITRTRFVLDIEQRLVAEAESKGWVLPSSSAFNPRKKHILALVLMPDFPSRILEDKFESRQHKSDQLKNTASLDSELTLLGARYPIEGALYNPFYTRDASLQQARPRVLAVTRIDAPSPEAIRRMIQDPVQVEKQGLWGWTVVDQGGPFASGDKWFAAAASHAKTANQALFYETSKKTLATAFPLMPRTSAYFGWYAGQPDGPFHLKTPGNFRFPPGAIACHLFSFSAVPSVRDSSSWCGALLERGAAVTAGNVHEPYLGHCLNYDVFYDRLLKGYTVAEAGLMASPSLSWQGAIYGDPLYRPYAALKKGTHAVDNPFAVWRNILQGARGNTAQILRAVQQRLTKPDGAIYAEMFAWYCLENNLEQGASTYFSLACRASRTHADKLRNRLMQISTMFSFGDKDAAKALMRATLQENSTSPHAPAVEALADVVIKEERPAPVKK